jgi:hypothetical protein
VCWAVRLVVFAAASVAPKIKTRHQYRKSENVHNVTHKYKKTDLDAARAGRDLNAYSYFILNLLYTVQCSEECSYQALHYAESGCKMGPKYRS